MGKFINEIKKRGAYAYGSRKLGVATEASDYDWAMLDTAQNQDFLISCGFKKVKGEYQQRYSGWKPVTKIAGMEGEKLTSYRKGKTNVVLMTHRLLQANKYATDMLVCANGFGLETKEERIEGYQRYCGEYGKLMNLT